MKTDAERMIAVLSSAIDMKCAEIKEKRTARNGTKIFVLLCIAAILIPTLFVFFGFNLMTLIIPVIFIAVAFLILSPILINQQGGRTYEQA